MVVAWQGAVQVLRRAIRVDCKEGERERDKELCFSDDWEGEIMVGRPTLHIVPVLCPASAATHAYGNAHDARTEDQQAADRNQDEPREVEA